MIYNFILVISDQSDRVNLNSSQCCFDIKRSICHIAINAIFVNKNFQPKKKEYLIKVEHMYYIEEYVKQNFIMISCCVLMQNKSIHQLLI